MKQKLEKKDKTNERLIKHRKIIDIRILLEQQEEKDYYKPKIVSSFWNNNYIKYESNDYRSRNYHWMNILIKLNLTSGT